MAIMYNSLVLAGSLKGSKMLKFLTFYYIETMIRFSDPGMSLGL